MTARAWFAMLAAALALYAAQDEKARPKRAEVAAVEEGFNERVKKISLEDPMEVLSSAQGVYLQGYGAVFTAQVDLIVTPTLNPFRQTISPQEVERVRQRKLARLATVVAAMKETMAAAARQLETVPAKEQIVLAVSLFYSRWEDRNGLPGQIVMKAERQSLLSKAAGAIQVEQY
ncbi:MAG: hypothetical protein ACE15B_18620 [Bryobacteraceae bacterium]